MEDDGRAVLAEHLPHALLLLAVGEHRDGVERVPVLDQLARDLEEVVLGVVDQHEPARPHAGDLARELGADRAAGARHHHAAAGQVAARRLDVHPHGLAAEHVLHAHLADLLDVAAAARLEQLEDRRHRLHPHAALAARLHDARAQRAGRRGDRDQHLVGLDVVEHVAELLGGAEHVEAAVDAHALLARVVVDEPDGPHAEVGVAQDLPQQQPAAVARADDQHRARAAAGAVAAHRPLEVEVHRVAHGAQEDEREQAVEHEHAGRDRDRHEAARVADEDLLRLDHGDVGDEREHRRDDGLDDAQVLALRGVAHPVPVEPEAREDRHAADDDERQRVLEQLLVVARDAAVEAQAVGEVVGQRDQPGVHQDLGQRVPVDGEGRKAGPAAHPEQSIGAGGEPNAPRRRPLRPARRSARGSAGSRRACARAPRWPAAPRRRPTRPSRAGGARARGSRPCGRCPAALQPLGERVDRLVAHDVEVPRRVAARRGAGQLDQLAEAGALVGRGAGAAPVAPGVEVRQLDAQDRRLQLVERASCGRRARTCPCPWSRGSAAAGSARRARRRPS